MTKGIHRFKIIDSQVMLILNNDVLLPKELLSTIQIELIDFKGNPVYCASDIHKTLWSYNFTAGNMTQALKILRKYWQKRGYKLRKIVNNPRLKTSGLNS